MKTGTEARLPIAETLFCAADHPLNPISLQSFLSLQGTSDSPICCDLLR